MADVMSKEERSRCMAAIKGKDTKPELIVRKYLFSRGLRFRIQVRKLPGTPDIVLPKYKTVIFVNGCFWHGHEGCKYSHLPKSNADFWQKKISHNKARDVSNTAVLKMMGWRVIRVWECDIKTVYAREGYLNKLYDTIVNPVVNPITQYASLSEPDDISIAAEPDPESAYGKEIEK